MPLPNNGLIAETNRQYYEGAQGFIANGTQTSFTTTFDTNLVFGSYNPTAANYALNNFKLYTSPTGYAESWAEYTSAYTVAGNTITLNATLSAGTYIVVQLKVLTGGYYGDPEVPGSYAFGNTVEDNYRSYSYITLDDVVNNFMIAYVGNGKLIGSAKKTDVIFHAKRSLQEFSYDVLKSVKSQELTIPPNLSVVIPQDYVNYVRMSWIDWHGVKHIIYPTNNLTIDPSETPVQDDHGVPVQDDFNSNIEGSSITEERWKDHNGGYASYDLDAFAGDWRNGDQWIQSTWYGRKY